ncbi:MAG: hypothetical protein N2320_05800 [Candidatus Bipolaricaulota bacterium]|nr:hypothetical protein [Candidatus Bipolaricaulota bacterium]
MRRLGVAALAIGGGLLLGGCFFVRAPEEAGPALVVGNLLGGVGQEVEIPLEVVGFPSPGVGGVVVQELRYRPGVLEVRGIEGRNGFSVLCSCIDNTGGRVKFALVNPADGLSSGLVGVLKGVRVGTGDPQFALDPAAVQVVDGANVLLPGTGFAIRLGGAPLYWVRR